MPYREALEQLHGAITGTATAPALCPHPRLSANEQLAIYRDGYRLRLRQAVLDDYPCLAAYIGEEKMTSLADAYVTATPPTSYNLDFYPLAFWHFVQKNSDDAATCELAELEGAMAEIFMGKGDEPLHNLPPLNEEALGQMKLSLRCPYRLLSFTHDVEATMEAFKHGETPVTIAPNHPYLLLHRHKNEVRRNRLEPAEYHLLSALASGTVFDAAIEQTLAATSTSEEYLAAHIAGWLARWLREGFFAAA